MFKLSLRTVCQSGIWIFIANQLNLTPPQKKKKNMAIKKIKKILWKNSSCEGEDQFLPQHSQFSSDFPVTLDGTTERTWELVGWLRWDHRKWAGKNY